MRLQDIMSPHQLFFEAEQLNIDNNYFRVVGKPFGPNGAKFQYKALKTPWRFSTYENVVFACIGWAETFFETTLENLHVFQFTSPHNKANFMIKIGSMNKSYTMGAEKFHPFLVIEYGYDTPTKIHLKLGFSRFACVNGIITGYQDASKLTIDISHLGQPIALNPCYLKQYGRVILQKIKWLKNMPLPLEAWEVPEHVDYLKRPYALDLGQNVWAYLNALSEYATFYSKPETLNLSAHGFSDPQTTFPPDNTSRRPMTTPNADNRLQSQVGGMFNAFAQLAISSLTSTFTSEDFRKMAFYQELQTEHSPEDPRIAEALKRIHPSYYLGIIEASPFHPKARK